MRRCQWSWKVLTTQPTTQSWPTTACTSTTSTTSRKGVLRWSVPKFQPMRS
jgi:hypothetical protein